MPEGGSLVTLTYMGRVRLHFPFYNVIVGRRKAALEAATRYLAKRPLARAVSA